MFYTRPNIQPLDIDLIEFEGGGSCPAQFFGRTADGRPIYIGYRSGHFTVHRGQPGAPFWQPLESSETMSFGPWLHGSMLREQACDLAGITVRGKRPFLSPEALRVAAEKDWILDWSGRTTYWIREIQVTEKGSCSFVEALRRRFPDLRIWERWYGEASGWHPRWRLRDTIAECEHYVTLGIGADEHRLAKFLDGDKARSTDLTMAFAHAVSFRFNWANQNTSSYSLIQERYPDVTCIGSRLSGVISTEFKTGDPDGVAFVNGLIASADECFSNDMERIDLATGESLGRTSSFAWYSHDLRDWSRAEPKRYLWVGEADRGSPPSVGLRPA
jgi:hypothetical protein